MPKLTKRFVESIIPDPQKPLKFWDDELRRFGIIVLPSGRRTYCIEYRNTTRIQKRVKIGVHGQITAEEARNLARIQLGQVAHGEDVATQSRQMRNSPTFIDLANDYLEHHGPKKKERSLNEDKKLLKSVLLPALGSLRVDAIDRRKVEKLHLSLARTPYHANRTLALLSKMFSLAISWGWIDTNPARGILKYHEEKRDRWLNHEEMQRLWSVLDNYPRHISAYLFKFLLLTGARKGEAMQATWDQFDLEKRLWRKPSHLTKQKKTEYLPLSEKALKILTEIKELSGSSKFVFPKNGGDQPIKEPRTLWKIVTQKANLENVRIHDLRHTHASHLVSSGLSLSIVGKLLGHTQASTTQRYAHLADEPLREAAELFSSKIG
jgi:integrase